jgi:hypothetical protein
MKGQVFKPLIEGLTWCEIIAEALRTANLDVNMSTGWDSDAQRNVADHIIAALRRSCRPDPLDLEVERLRAELESCGVPGAGR